MTEFTLGTLAVIALGICVLDCFCWMWGGRSQKFMRRFVGSTIQSIGINIIGLIVGTWVFQYLISIIPEAASRCMGYGVNDDNTMMKIFRRSVFALGSLATGIVLAWGLSFSGKAMLVVLCQAIASIVSIILSVKNPLPAAVEEVFVCLSLKYCNYMYMFIALS